MSRECCSSEEPSDLAIAGLAPLEESPGGSVGGEEILPWWRDRSILTPLTAGVLLFVGYLFTWTGSETIGAVVLGLSLLVGASTFVPGTIRRLMKGRLGVGLLMTIAAAGAVLLGHVGEAAALAFLFSIAEALEDRAMDAARRGLRAVLSLIPETAVVSLPSGEESIRAADIQVHDTLVVRPGDRVATDGVVTSGRSGMDASAVTGESIPVEVGPGDVVAAGSVNGGGSLLVQASAGGRDNSLTTIVRLVEQAQTRKGAQARLADRIARPLVPIVLVVAALIMLFGFLVGDPATWTERALVVLVATSPCALAIAVPVTVISAIGASSRFGVVIKSGEAFEQLGAVRTVAFDKTGTLTRNRPEVVQVEAADPNQALKVVALAAALESHSTHPLAAALREAQPSPPQASEVCEYPGQGISGTVAGAYIRVGSPRWVPVGTLAAVAEGMETAGMTVIVVEADGEAAGVIGVRDEARPEARAAVDALRAQGLDVVMLTGDNERTAQTLAAQLGIAEVRAAQMPAQKASAVEELRASTTTAMIGDGINDAPALAAANVGIAMGVTGSAAAIESADVAFTGTDLRLIPQALAHARRGRRIMTGNIALALAIIIVLLPLALFGVLGLAGVVLVHELAEIIVIANGVRAAKGRAVLH